jgi:glycerol-3-phosphate dehydrogenase
VYGNILLGPTAENISDKEDVGTTEEMLNRANAGARLLVPKISGWRNNIRSFAGLRAVPDTDDFVIQEADGAPNFIDVAGMKSPGLSSALAIALYVVSMMKDKGLILNKKESFNPIVKRKLFIEMTEEEQSALIKKNPLYGRVVCRCENITEGDIVDSIKRKIGATTMDGVKRRCRAGMGRCQSGFCGPIVQQILARELNKPLEEIVLEKNSSYILIGKTK